MTVPMQDYSLLFNQEKLFTFKLVDASGDPKPIVNGVLSFGGNVLNGNSIAQITQVGSDAYKVKNTTNNTYPQKPFISLTAETGKILGDGSKEKITVTQSIVLTQLVSDPNPVVSVTVVITDVIV